MIFSDRRATLTTATCASAACCPYDCFHKYFAMTTTVASPRPSVLFETQYGVFQPAYLWLLPALAVLGLLGVPIGLFWNTGWRLGVQPLEPWQVTVIVEIFAVSALILAGVLTTATIIRRKSPQRVALTATTLIVPKGMFSQAERELPRSEIDVKVFDVGFVKQLQIMHKRRKILLSSAMFRSTADFDQLASLLV